MDYGYADYATVQWSATQERYELTILEKDSPLWGWSLDPSFTGPAEKMKGNWLGVEHLNAHLAEAKIYPVGLNGWVPDIDGGWACKLSKRRERNKNDH